ncbi:hypothetical protein RhiirB3_396481, partial [Rhizophagus irregularis]
VIKSDITSNDFIENLVDELQVTLRSLLSGIEFENVIETWRIRHISRLSQRENLVVLLSDGTHLCTCMETVTKEGDDANNILDYTADQLLGQDVTNPNVTKIHEVPSKKRLKNAIELSKKKVLMQENLNEPNNQIRSQRKCLLCGKSGHYQKKCPNAKKNN